MIASFVDYLVSLVRHLDSCPELLCILRYSVNLSAYHGFADSWSIWCILWYSFHCV